LDDRLARYLRQQAELGGPEVYLSAARRLGGSAVGASVPDSSASTPEVPSQAADGAEARAAEPPSLRDEPPSRRVAESSRRAAEPSKWRKDAPPIPGAGFAVTPPEGGLLGDEVWTLDSLDAVAVLIRDCRKCRLCEGRTHAVPGEGHPAARLMCVGEGPGAKEDETGRPFVGAAGQLLDQILAAIECPRESVYIANIVKCRPPQNRKPLPDEAQACLPYLHRQIALIRPKVLVALGGTAAEWLLGVKRSLGDLRGKVHRYGSIPLIVTYHPAALLRNPHWKKPTWDDVRIARQLLDQ
jgi:DNA polymerase